jgi:hypothetical protein
MVHRVLSLALVVTLSVTVVAAASAQEKFSDTRVFTVVKAETLPVGDVEGHVLVLSARILTETSFIIPTRARSQHGRDRMENR